MRHLSTLAFRIRWIRKQRFQGCLYSGCFSARVLAQVGKAFRLNLHLTGDTPFSGFSHRYQMIFPKGSLHLAEPFGIGQLWGKGKEGTTGVWNCSISRCLCDQS
jgi:hypothetical protein